MVDVVVAIMAVVIVVVIVEINWNHFTFSYNVGGNVCDDGSGGGGDGGWGPWAAIGVNYYYKTYMWANKKNEYYALKMFLSKRKKK